MRPVSKLAVATLFILITISFAAGQEPAIGDHWQDLDTNEGDNDVEAVPSSFWDRFSLSMLSVFAVSEQSVHPGDTVTIEHTLSSRGVDQVVEADDTILAVETYLCQDSGCDDPFGDQLVEELSWRTGTDEIGSFGGSGSHAFYRGEVSLHIPSVYTLVDPVTGAEQFSEVHEGHYATVIYVVDTANTEVISDVWSPDDPNEEWRARFQIEHEPPAIDAAEHPPDVDVQDGTVTGTVHLENRGGDMDSPYLVEMQVRDEGESLLNLGSGTQQLCDPAHPENVHKEYQLDSGESTAVTLETDAVEPGQEYDVWFVTGTDCMDDGGERTEPYGTGFKAETVCVGDCSSSDGDDDSGDNGDGGGGSGIPVTWLLLGAGAVLILGGVMYRGRE